MSTRPRKLAELPSANSISSNDLFLIEKMSSNSSVTSTITASSLRKSIFKGPFANDSVANSNGIAVGEPYYIATGEVRVRIS